MLEVGPYPYYLKRRIAGDRGHLSNEASGRMLDEILHEGMKKVLLGHISHHNNYAELARETVRMEVDLSTSGWSADDFSIEPASRDHPSELIEL